MTNNTKKTIITLDFSNCKTREDLMVVVQKYLPNPYSNNYSFDSFNDYVNFPEDFIRFNNFYSFVVLNIIRPTLNLVEIDYIIDSLFLAQHNWKKNDFTLELNFVV
jgi:hypothetical protein